MLRIVSVGSYRRGTGKSTIIAGLAVQAALMGWRVGIADLNDLFPSSQNFLFELPEPTGSLVDFMRGDTGIESVGSEVLVDPDKGTYLRVFPWVSSPSEDTRFDVLDLHKALLNLSRYHSLDFLLLDLGAGSPDFNLLMAAISDCCLIVTCLDQMDCQGTAVMVDALRSLNSPWVLLIANQMLGKYDPGLIREEIAAAYHAPTTVLPFSTDIADVGSGGLFSLRYPDHPWSRGVRSIAASLFSDLAGQAVELPCQDGPPSILNHSLGSLMTRPAPHFNQRDLPQRPRRTS